MALGSTQPLTEMITRSIYWGKGGRCLRLTNLPPSCAFVMKCGKLNFLEPSGPLQVCNGTDLPLPLHISDSFFLSPRERIVSLRHLVCATLCRWPSGMHTRRSSTQSDIYQRSCWYISFSCWWTHSCPKHVENRNQRIYKINLCQSILYWYARSKMYEQICYLHWWK